MYTLIKVCQWHPKLHDLQLVDEENKQFWTQQAALPHTNLIQMALWHSSMFELMP